MISEHAFAGRRSRCQPRAGISVVGALLLLLPVQPALAYRPFDSTDADVAQENQMDIEFGPLGYLQEGKDQFLVSPAVVVNFGIENEREIVLEGKLQESYDTSATAASTSLVDTGISMKQVLRLGSLQEQSGPSVAAEYGVRLPTVNGESGIGASVTGIVSQRWRAGTIHLNCALVLDREHRGETFLGLIGEAPYAWSVRPVTEVFVQDGAAEPHTVSGLVGAIWRARNNLSIDGGFRAARANNEKVKEWRIGFTWSVPYRSES